MPRLMIGVVTPRIGKPIEVNALWYSALAIMSHLAKELGKPSGRYETMARKAITGFSRFLELWYGLLL
jgi:glycogen debranching enzyme